VELLPVLAYAPDRFAPEARSLVDLLEERPVVGGYTEWTEFLDWSTWWLGYVAGAFALSQEAWPALKPLLAARFTEINEPTSPVGRHIWWTWTRAPAPRAQFGYPHFAPSRPLRAPSDRA
jgi:hypothetical protein